MQLCEIKGIGEKRERELNLLGIYTALDLATYFPSKYVSHSLAKEIVVGASMVFTIRILTPPQVIRSKNKKRYAECVGETLGERVKLVWFASDYIAKLLREGQTYTFGGKMQEGFGMYSMVNPIIIKGSAKDTFTPIYSLKNADISQGVFSELATVAAKSVRLSSIILNPDKLMDLSEAVVKMHTAKGFAAVSAAKSRLALEEILQLMTALGFAKKNNTSVKSHKYLLNDCLSANIKSLPFALTKSQSHALNEIFRLLQGECEMNAMLSGDVGSGKTIVAMLAMLLTVRSGHQAALLAPTEILASQHAKNFQKFFPQVEIAYLSGSQKKEEKEENLSKIKNGKCGIIIGTHAIFQKAVQYHDLAFVVTDEQHRFGVRQRAAFSSKGRNVDVLVMSATPIPRTLSLAIYGDLDIITIDKKPIGRKEVKTSIVPMHKHMDMLAYIKNQLAQCYIVCPSIYKNEDSELSSVLEVFESLKDTFCDDVACLHGDMSEEIKAKTASDFASGKIKVLVATTIIEVGIDVKNADIMVIYDSDRFGLSTLHQLRGRVGRGDRQGYCFLLTKSESLQAKRRLKILKENSSGFVISEKDFMLRGCGDLLGDRQSGFIKPVFRGIALDGKIVSLANEIFKCNDISEEFFMENAFLPYQNILKIIL